MYPSIIKVPTCWVCMWYEVEFSTHLNCLVLTFSRSTTLSIEKAMANCDGFPLLQFGWILMLLQQCILIELNTHQLQGIAIVVYMRVPCCISLQPCLKLSLSLSMYCAVIRKGTFARYNYGLWGNLKRYGRMHPPAFDLQDIPESLPLWMAYGGTDALADVTDVKRTMKELRSEPKLLYLDTYGHLDFIMSVKAKDDVYGSLIKFFRSVGGSSSY